MDKSNSWAVWTCVLIQQALGYAWYSDLLFKNTWAVAMGKNPADVHPNAIAFIMLFTASVLMTRMLGWLFVQLKITDAFRGALIALLAWMAFCGPLLAGHYLAMGLSNTVILLDAGKEFLAFGMTGALLAIWPKKQIS